MTPFSRNTRAALRAFVVRCDRYCRGAKVTRAWLSKAIFGKAGVLGDLADASASDDAALNITISRIERAEEKLTELESDEELEEAA